MVSSSQFKLSRPMPRFGPIKRNELIHYLRRLGFAGPFAGRKHQLMIREHTRVRLPNPHEGDISPQLLATVLRLAEISRDEWERL